MTLALNLDGFTNIPNGKVANIATYLEIVGQPTLRPVPENDFLLTPMAPAELERYKTLFRAVGEEWLWFSRLTIDDATLSDLINKPTIEVFALQQAECDIGLFELDLRDGRDMELLYFGLSQNVIGTGAGRVLMNEALRRIFHHHKAERLEVHTCTMDSPQALTFYMRSGFKPYQRAIEIADDPRLSGHILPDCAAHHPIIK